MTLLPLVFESLSRRGCRTGAFLQLVLVLELTKPWPPPHQIAAATYVTLGL